MHDCKGAGFLARCAIVGDGADTVDAGNGGRHHCRALTLADPDCTRVGLRPMPTGLLGNGGWCITPFEVARMRLPIFGEASADRLRRVLRDDPSFGLFLWESIESDREEHRDDPRWPVVFGALWEEIDLDRDARFVSPNDVVEALDELGHDLGSDMWAAYDEACRLFFASRLVRHAADGYAVAEHCCFGNVDANAAPTRAGIYFVQQGADGPIKIGKANNVRDRMRGLQTSNPYPLRLLGVVDGGMSEEADLHRRFADARMQGEWFRPDASILQYLRAAAVCIYIRSNGAP